MIRSGEIISFWLEFCETRRLPEHVHYQVWYFGDSQGMARELAELVIAGNKTATASMVSVNQIKHDTAPVVGGYSVVTDFDNEPKCVIRTEEVRHLPFSEVDEKFAFDEGEGDRSLEYWRTVHRDYFKKEALENSVEFGPRSMICCERFALLYHR
jgi:uncharacterized protein YhfF